MRVKVDGPPEIQRLVWSTYSDGMLKRGRKVASATSLLVHSRHKYPDTMIESVQTVSRVVLSFHLILLRAQTTLTAKEWLEWPGSTLESTSSLP